MKHLKSNFDRISDLPESLQCHILSFLPTIDAVATSFLSTKWTNLWKTLPDISFNDSTIPSNMYFATFVNRVLIFHNAPSINKFSLYCGTADGTLCDLHAWVTWAILKNVRVLDITLLRGYDLKFRLPVCLFSCQMLEVLKLEGNIVIEVRTTMCLSKLRRLELINVQYYQNDESASNLISSCTSLESLRISRMEDDGVDTFTISSSTLKSLTVKESVDYIEFVILKYVINAPALQYLDIVRGTVNGFLFENSTSFEVVDICDTDHEENDYASFNSAVPRFLQDICSVRTLNLGEEIFKSSISANLFPKFDRLIVLRAQAYCCHWSLLQAFIINSEKLEHLTFSKVPCSWFYHERKTICWRNPESVPKCLLTSLRKVLFIGFDGWEDELAMVKYILQNGRGMQKMKIQTRYTLDDKMKVKLLQKLLNFRRGSIRCQVTIT